MRTRLRSALLAGLLAVASTAVALAIPGTAQAATARWGYLWASRETATDYTPVAAFQKQSNGQSVTVHRNGVGNYAVTFHGLAGTGNQGIVQVTAVATADTCQSAGWQAVKTNVVATILCFRPGGALADAEFDAVYTVLAGTGAVAYGWMNLAHASGTLPTAYSFDGRGGQLSSTHNATGSYTVRIPNLAGANGTVKVTPYGLGQTFCTVATWGGNLVRVNCANSAGRPADTMFDITFANQLPLLGVPRTTGYVWNSRTATSYIDLDNYGFDSAGGTITVTHLKTGSYEVTFGGFAQAHGDVQVTAYGAVPTVTCTSNGWLPQSSAERVDVVCYSRTGAYADSLFTMQFFV